MAFLLLLDVILVVLAFLFAVGVALAVAMGLAGLVVPHAATRTLIVLGLANIVQWAVLWVALWRDYLKSDEESVPFWIGVMLRYAILGSALYFHCSLRDRVLRSPSSGRQPLRSPLRLFNSPLVKCMRLINKSWMPLFCILIGSAFLAPFPRGWEFLFGLSRILASVTLAVGFAVSLALMVLLIRDAAAKSRGPAADRDAAAEINSSLYWPRAAERYVRHVLALEAAADGS